MKHGLRLAAGVSALLLATVAACGGDDDDTSAGAEGGSGADGPTLEIVEPAESGAVSVPFTLNLESSEELGPEDSGLHHVHVFFDGDDSTYEIVRSETWEIGPDSPAVEGLTPGEHVLNASLRHADHSAAGAEAEITVMVGEGGATAPTSEESETQPPPVYDY